MAETVDTVATSSVSIEEKKEKKSKKEKKEAEPEPEFYIPPEDRKAALEEMAGLFDPSIKKKSKKRSATNGNGTSVENGGILILLTILI